MGWGIVTLFHGLGLFVFGDDSAFKEKMIEKEMNKNNMENK
jgi:hypothetical protein